MIIAVTEQFHDYQPRQYFVDVDKLDPHKHIDSLILGESQKSEDILRVHLDATDWESNPKNKGQEPQVSEAAKRLTGPADKMLYLTVYFDA